MAKAPATGGKAGEADPAAGETAVKQPTGGITVLAFVILTAVAAALGSGFGLQISSLLLENISLKETEQEKEKKDAGVSVFASPLPPITTNISSTSRVWIRLEASLISPAALGAETASVTTEVSEDIISYLRTVNVEQLEGPGGFQHLREDLNERVRLRTHGKVSGILVQALVIE